MTIVEINGTNFGSTGNIMLQISEIATNNGHNVYMACPQSRDNMRKSIKNQVFIGSRLSRNIHRVMGTYTGLQDCFSVVPTLAFLHKIRKLKPDLIHLHNLHGNYINLPILFSFIKRENITVIWTLHDCWSFTGQCPYFTMVKCDKWKTGCHACAQTSIYPASKIDCTRTMWNLKRKWFNGVKCLTVVTPSNWLANLVKQSFLKNYPVKVINNGIDLNIFKPTESDFRQKHHIGEKYVLLGVTFGWERRKGIDVFIELSQILDEEFQIVLVGTNEDIDKQIPENIVSIHKTQDQIELAKIYSAADVFVNPTREENFPTVNIEAIACGTPVVTFDTGGSPEIIDDTCGSVVGVDDIDVLVSEIHRICRDKPYKSVDCIQRSRRYNQNDRFMDYVKLFESVIRK